MADLLCLYVVTGLGLGLSSAWAGARYGWRAGLACGVCLLMNRATIAYILGGASLLGSAPKSYAVLFRYTVSLCCSVLIQCTILL